MAERLTEYRASTLSDILSAKKFIEAIVNSIDDPMIGLNMEREILFINEEALNVLNLKREECDSSIGRGTVAEKRSAPEADR